MTLSRRSILTRFFSLTVMGSLLKPMVALAAWPKNAFRANTFANALQTVTGGRGLIESPEVHLKAPELAENGAVVPISVRTTLPAVKSIALLVEKNPIPLAAKFSLADETEAFISARIKMAESCDVIVVVESGDQFFSTQKFVKVTIGGCGG